MVNVRFDEEMHDHMRALAKQNDRSLGGEVRAAVRLYINGQEPAATPTGTTASSRQKGA